ncbi:NUDIX hydrolase [Erythrobacter sp. HL-111]|uniref:NUDIX hydrolase n=1 Tax=Erythrobacter sp. HL-111 TaxID=1798193 RepID=UPI0006DB7F99|nr:NUDIX hydrolase [Erythrobacter sp. HL-111]KPP91478.1 MAG: ADP-ribose pyrophosphatase NudF [Erythrobacteraceae bacterium HL-111]SDS25568.1 ADP-ribose pyrophosphatase [Erythrobacter sp. HL-111]
MTDGFAASQNDAFARDRDADLPEQVRWEGRFITAMTRGRWEYVGRARGIRAAAILAIDTDADGTRHVILVSQYRVPLSRFCLEIPAGLVGDADGSEDENALEAAARELEEETGYRAGRLEVLGEFYSSPGMVSESFTLLRATGLERVGEGGGLVDENIMVHRVPLSGLSDYVARWREAGHGVDVRIAMLLTPHFLGEELT